MKLTIEPTTQVVFIGGRDVPARVWEGTDERGTRCTLFVTLVAVLKSEPPEAQAEFDRALQEQRPPTAAWPPRLLL